VENNLSRRVALATCAEIPDGDEDFPALIEELGALGVAAEAAVWDDPGVDWSRYDLVLPRSTWDYAERRDEFLDWARSVPRILNPVPLLEWNTDKQRYLTDLVAAGVPVVPTVFVDPGQELEPPKGPFVVKPAISAGGRRSARFGEGELEAARELVGRIHADGRTAMVQPHLGDAAEIGLVVVDGRYSHAVRRRVPLPQAGEQDVLYLAEELAATEPTQTDCVVAEAALTCAGSHILYGRVDLIAGVVLELEVTEPSLYLTYGQGSARRFAHAITRRL
jgi:glutathione synthase/RimK-type ligase-like ATP-grasp enzyme